MTRRYTFFVDFLCNCCYQKYTAQKMKKSWMENFIFCVMIIIPNETQIVKTFAELIPFNGILEWFK